MHLYSKLLGLAFASSLSIAHAQTLGPPGGSGGGSSGTITANSTQTSGFTAGQYLYSDGSLVQAGSFGTGVATALGNTAGGASGFALVGTTPPTGSAGGDLTGTYPNPTLAGVITAGGPTGSATVVPIITYDAKGRLTAVTTATIAPGIGSITGLGTGIATALGTNVGTAGAPVILNGAGGSPSSLGTLPAHTLGGAISGGGNQINNVVIGASSPLAGNFTSIGASGDLTITSATTTAINIVASNANSIGFHVNNTFSGSNDWLIGTSGNVGPANNGDFFWYDNTGGGSKMILRKTTGSAIFNSTEAPSSKTTGSIVGGGGMGLSGTIYATFANVATTSALCYNTSSGLITYDGTVGTCTVSDERLKDIQGPITGALAKLLQINGFYYTWKDPANGAGRQIGVGAQTVEKVFPELVSTDSAGTKSADYQRLTAPIIEALRELKADNDNLRTCQQNWKCRIFGYN